MNLQEYIQLCQTTKSHLFIEPAAINKPIDDILTIDVTHAIIGLATEAGELLGAVALNSDDLVNFQEEFGDLLWYCGIYFYARDFNVHSEQTGFGCDISLAEVVNRIVEISLMALDRVKKSLFYNRPFNYKETDWDFYQIYIHIENWCIQNNYSISQLMDQNIEKLRTRYPDKFNAEKANNRDLVSERKSLENVPTGSTFGVHNVIRTRLGLDE